MDPGEVFAQLLVQWFWASCSASSCSIGISISFCWILRRYLFTLSFAVACSFPRTCAQAEPLAFLPWSSPEIRSYILGSITKSRVCFLQKGQFLFQNARKLWTPWCSKPPQDDKRLPCPKTSILLMGTTSLSKVSSQTIISSHCMLLHGHLTRPLAPTVPAPEPWNRLAVRPSQRGCSAVAVALTAMAAVRKSARKVAVVGGGPAGLAACRFLEQFGHQPTVFETSSHLDQSQGYIIYL